MKLVLKKEEINLRESSEKVDKLLKELEIENKKIKIKSDEVNVVKNACMEQKNSIELEREAANRDLAKAIPFLKKAVAAADSIKPLDIKELSGMRNAVDTTRLIMDTIHVLFMRPMEPVRMRPLKILKQDVPFVDDSFNTFTKNTLGSSNFLKDILEFSENQKDNINEETIELLEPYLTLKSPKEEDIFEAKVAKQSSSALEGLCVWAAAMSDYHKASKIVNPKIKLLDIKTGELKDAEEQLAEAEAELERVNSIKEALRKKYEDANNEKTTLEESAAQTKQRMEKANRLINSLADNKKRWEGDANEFKSLK
jgi:dynein heavy chain